MLVLAAFAGLGAHEVYIIARRAGYQPWYPAGIALSLFFALRGYLGGNDILSGIVYTGPGTGVEIIVLSMVLFFALTRQGLSWARGTISSGRGPSLTNSSASKGWADVGITLGGAIYTGGLLGYAPFLLAIPESSERGQGIFWVMFVILGTAACDTGAYVVGRRFGRHKLIPHISPGKTWEGLIGGVLGGVIAGAVLSGLLHLSIFTGILLGLVVCAAAVSGDLCESMLKRAAGVKNSGTLIPGHGGVLDRLDSILFVTIAVYWFARVIVL